MPFCTQLCPYIACIPFQLTLPRSRCTLDAISRGLDAFDELASLSLHTVLHPHLLTLFKMLGTNRKNVSPILSSHTYFQQGVYSCSALFAYRAIRHQGVLRDTWTDGQQYASCDEAIILTLDLYHSFSHSRMFLFPSSRRRPSLAAQCTRSHYRTRSQQARRSSSLDGGYTGHSDTRQSQIYRFRQHNIIQQQSLLAHRRLGQRLDPFLAFTPFISFQ